MKLSVNRVQDTVRLSSNYIQAVSQQFGQLLETVGIAKLKVSQLEVGAAKAGYVGELVMFDNVPEEVRLLATCLSQHLAQSMLLCGIVELSLGELTDEERKMLSDVWATNAQANRNTRLAPPPDLSPDMAPIDVKL